MTAAAAPDSWRDDPHQEGEVTEVSGASVSFGDGWGVGWPPDAGPAPRVGDTLRVIGELGFAFYGVAVNGALRWWLSPEERERRREEATRRAREASERRFVENEERLDAEFELLPMPLQVRIEQLLQRGGREWRVANEAYEMFVCGEAARMAEHFGSPDDLLRWLRLPYEEQRAEWDGFSDEHSGNTFAAAGRLALLLLQGGDRSEAAIVVPQALAPLVGDPRYPQD